MLRGGVTKGGIMMRKRNLGSCIIAMIVVGLLAVPGLNTMVGPAEAEEVVLKAAVQDEMKTTNILNGNDVWTSHVLWQSYEGVIQSDPNTLDPVPYVLMGLETNGDKGLQAGERMLPPVAPTGFLPGEASGKDLRHDAAFQDALTGYTDADKDRNQIIAYFNFENLYFHDGEPVDIWDILFSYHLIALHPRWYTDVVPLMDMGGLSGNYTNQQIGRWLWVWEVDDYDSNDKTAALRFQLTKNYAQLWTGTLNVPIFPKHIWEDTGKLMDPDTGSVKKSSLHVDFGKAINPNRNGIGVNEDNAPPGWVPYKLSEAQGWDPNQDEIIGTGMFKFYEYVQGSHAKVVVNDRYLELLPDIHVPEIDAIEFIKFSTPQQATMGLKKGDADIILWSVPPDFLPDLQSDPNIAILSNPEPGFFYLAFNMRTSMFGYPGGEKSQGDKGLHLRKAIAHLIDKKTIVDIFLQGYGILADGPVSPLNTFWYNSSLPGYEFNPSTAAQILDNNGYTDPNLNGWRDLDPHTPGEQDGEIELLAPTADYDPIRAQACILIEANLRAAGINVKCNPQAFGTIITKIDARTFDLYILGWSIGGTDPDYLYSFFYSMNRNPGGQNYPGYQSDKFDTVIVDSREEMNLTKRQAYIKEAQGILANDLPYNVLYYRKNIEAYRVNSFTGWETSASGTIFNYWSLMNIKRPSEQYLRTTIKVASAVSSFKNETVTVTVRDQDKSEVSGAGVELSADQGGFYLFQLPLTDNQYLKNGDVDPALIQKFENKGISMSAGAKMTNVTIVTDTGNLTYWQIKDGAKEYWFEEDSSNQQMYVYGNRWDGLILTNANGQVTPKYKAPYTNNDNGTRIGITVKASKLNYDDSGIKSVFIIVFPPGAQFISVTIDLPFGDLINEGESTEIAIEVKDQDGNSVDGASLTITSTPTDLEIEPKEGTSSNGGKMEGIVLTAPEVSTDTQYIISVRPTKAGSKGVEGSVVLSVIDITAPPSTPGFDALTVVAALSIAAATYGIIRLRRKKD
jgi:ABC-type transport system substrate-binding protein